MTFSFFEIRNASCLFRPHNITAFSLSILQPVPLLKGKLFVLWSHMIFDTLRVATSTAREAAARSNVAHSVRALLLFRGGSISIRSGHTSPLCWTPVVQTAVPHDGEVQAFFVTAQPLAPNTQSPGLGRSPVLGGSRLAAVVRKPVMLCRAFI